MQTAVTLKEVIKMGVVAHDYKDFCFIGDERPEFRAGGVVSVKVLSTGMIKNYSLNSLEILKIENLILEVERTVNINNMRTIFCKVSFQNKDYDAIVFLSSNDRKTDFIRLTERLPLVSIPLSSQR